MTAVKVIQRGRPLRWRAWTLAPVLLVVGGCATSNPVNVPLQTTPAAAAPTIVRTASKPAFTGCSAQFGQVLDQRADQGGVGEVSGRRLQTVDVPSWVREAIRSAAGEVAPVVIDGVPAKSGVIVLDVSITQAYVMQVNMAKSSTVAMKIRYTRDGVLLREAPYRGAYTSIFWSLSGDEMAASLNEALQKAVEPVGRDLLALCGSAGARP